MLNGFIWLKICGSDEKNEPWRCIKAEECLQWLSDRGFSEPYSLCAVAVPTSLHRSAVHSRVQRCHCNSHSRAFSSGSPSYPEMTQFLT
jgi:hypothetical protein